MHAASEGQRVLCLTIDPARRLANSLGLSEMRTEEQRVDPALFEANGLTLKGELSAMMLDTKGTFDALVRKTASSEEAANRILNNEVYRYLSTSLAGTQEYMAMEKLHDVWNEGYDLIVLDTPPTSNALDFLDAPERLAALIDSPAMRWFVDAFQGAGRFSFNLVSKSASLVLKGLSKFTGTAFLETVAEFVSEFNDLFGGFKERAKAISATLRSPEVAFLIVTSPSPLAVDEGLFFDARLAEAEMQRDAFVVNGVRPLLAEPDPKISSEELRDELAEYVEPEVDAHRALSQMRRALDDLRLDAEADRHQIERLRAAVGEDRLVVEVPAFESEVVELAALYRLSTVLMGYSVD